MIIVRTHRVTGVSQFWANGHWVRSVEKAFVFDSTADAYMVLVRYQRHCRSAAYFAYHYNVVDE